MLLRQCLRLRFIGIRQIDKDLPESLLLCDADLLVLHELKDHQECHDDLFLAVLKLQHLPEIRMRMALEICPDIQCFVRDTDLFPVDLPKSASYGIDAALPALHHVSKYISEALRCPVSDQLFIIERRHVTAHLLRKILLSEITQTCLPALFLKFLRHELVHLVLQKTLDKFVSRILFIAFLIFFSGQEHTALDVKKCRGHDEELAGDVHVTVFHLSYIFQILIGYRDNRYVIDVYFVFLDQVHQKVHGSFEHLQFKRYRHYLAVSS